MRAPAVRHDQLDALIVGAGPSGLTLAKLLAGMGHRCMVVERRADTRTHPSAHVVNARSLEIFAQAGFDMAAIDAIAQDPLEAGHVNFLTRLNGRLIGRLDFERQGDECLEHTPRPLRNISQHRLEPILAACVKDEPLVDLRYRTEWVCMREDDDAVTCVLEDLETSQRHEVTSRYLIGADGASSSVRRALGIEMIGPASMQDFVSIHLRADLRPYVQERPGVLHFIMDPRVGGTFVAHDLEREWVFMRAFDPEAEPIETFDHERCAQLVRAAIGDEQAQFEILGVGDWHMTAQVAASMRSGRTFLVGDAAHRFPPTGGLGLNTGVADAHNLAWKLHAVESGWAGEGLLDTYELERLGIARINCEQSVTNAFKMVLLAEALECDEDALSLDAVLDDAERRARVADAVAAQAPHFDMLGLQLGYVYPEGALVREGPATEPSEDPGAFAPSGQVGERVPHACLDDGRSVLDLVGHSELSVLTLQDHEQWAEALDVMPVPVAHVRIDDRVGVGESWSRTVRAESGDALVVRPDQHIAARVPGPPDADRLEAVLAGLLAR